MTWGQNRRIDRLARELETQIPEIGFRVRRFDPVPTFPSRAVVADLLPGMQLVIYPERGRWLATSLIIDDSGEPTGYLATIAIVDCSDKLAARFALTTIRELLVSSMKAMSSAPEPEPSDLALVAALEIRRTRVEAVLAA